MPYMFKIDFEQGMLNKEQRMLNYFIVGTYQYFVKYEKRL